MPKKKEDPTAKLQTQLEEAETAKLRALADLENFRRRQAEEKAVWGKLSVGQALGALLPTLLELQLGAQHSQDEDLKKVVEKFFEVLKKEGLEPINPEPGTPTDPQMHEILMAEEGEPGTVVRVLEPGWKYQDLTLRPAKVSAAS